MISLIQKNSKKPNINKIAKKDIENKDFCKEYFYILLLGIIFCLLLTAITYNPADPSKFNISSDSIQSNNVSNTFGILGAAIADWLFQLFGISSIVFLFVFLVQLLNTFRIPKQKNRSYLRIFGYPQLLIFYLALAQALNPTIHFRGIDIYTGGIIGFHVYAWFKNLIGEIGAIIAIIIGFFSSLTLALGIRPLSSIFWLFSLKLFKKIDILQEFKQDISCEVEHNHALDESPLKQDANLYNHNIFKKLDNIKINSKEFKVDIDDPFLLDKEKFNYLLNSLKIYNNKNNRSLYQILQASQSDESLLAIFLGEESDNKFLIFDLCITQQVLITCYSNNLEKAKFLNLIIVNLLVLNTPTKLKLILIDPAKDALFNYSGIKHLLTEVISETNKAINMLNWLVNEMEQRYALMHSIHVYNIMAYNSLVEENDYFSNKNLEYMPYIVIIINDLNQLITTNNKEIIANILQILGKKAKDAGIHLIVAIDQSSSEVITLLMQRSMPCKIILQENTTDLLFVSAETNKVTKAKYISISTEEIDTISEQLRQLYGS